MSCNIFCFRSIFLFILRAALIVAFVAYFVSGAKAQEVKPSPTPSPTPTTLVPDAVASPTPPVDDKQNVKPKNLQGVPQIAPQYKFEDRSLPDLGRVGVDLMQQRPLTLREALELALNNNKDIEVARKNTQIAEFDLKAADGFYEPRFSGTSFYERANTPNISFFSTQDSITQDSINANLRLEGSVRKFGGTYRAEFNNSRVGTNNTFSILSPQYQSNLTFSYNQPLLRGRAFDQPRRQIEIAKKNLSLNDAQFRQRTIEVITNVQRAYWDLTFALKNLQVQRDAVRDAKQQLEHNQRLVNEGLLAPIDVVASETQVANFEQGVYDALNAVSQSENNLKNLVAQNRNDALWTVSVIPTDTVEIEPPVVDLTSAISEALENRPELDQNTVAQEINAIDQRYYRDQTKPQVDLTASYTAAGISGQQNPDFRAPSIGEPGQQPPPQFEVNPNLTGGYVNSVTDIFSNRYPTFRVGVTVNLPFKNQTAKAQLGRSLVEGQRVQTQREQLEQAIQVDVRNALQLIRTAQARLRAAAIARENGEKQYESEQRKLDAGQSTVFLVLERQTALTNARGNELRAQTELNKAIAELQRATGNSLRANNIVTRLK